MRIGAGASSTAAGTSIIRGRYLLTRALSDSAVETIEDGAVLQVDGRIAEIGRFDDIAARHPGLDVLGGPEALVVPGLTNTHHHIGLTPVQLGSPDLPLELWLTHGWQHRDIDPYLDTLYSAFELIASGVTAVQHLGRMKPAPVSGWRDEAGAVIAAYRDIGMRVSFAMCNRDQHRLVYADDDAFVAPSPPTCRTRRGRVCSAAIFASRISRPSTCCRCSRATAPDPIRWCGCGWRRSTSNAPQTGC